jgi:glycosyltransferase involved in cell wall biosynthesis
MNNLISVIIPVYNVEKYLDGCLDSICNQSYTNLEIILINDGSTDNSKDICEQFAKKDPRIIIVDQDNSGSSIARNTGLERASGEIISFVDSDDYIEKVMLEKMLRLMIEHNLDIVEIERNDIINKKIFDNKFVIQDQVTAIQRIITSTSFQVWKRIYRKSLIEDMRFIPNIIHQDVFFTIDVLNRISSIGYLNSPLYIYNRESAGIIRSKYSAMKRDVAIRATEYIIANVPKNSMFKKVVNNYIVYYYTDHFFLISRNKSFDNERKYRIKLKKEILKAANFYNIKFRSLLVILLPMRVLEIISSSYQFLKKINNTDNQNV